MPELLRTPAPAMLAAARARLLKRPAGEPEAAGRRPAGRALAPAPAAPLLPPAFCARRSPPTGSASAPRRSPSSPSGADPLLAAFTFVAARLLTTTRTGALLPHQRSPTQGGAQQPASSSARPSRCSRSVSSYPHRPRRLRHHRETINRSGKSPRGARCGRAGLLPLLVFWGPLLIGSVSAMLLRARPGSTCVRESWLVIGAGSGRLTCLWQVPFTRVRFKAALAGGVRGVAAGGPAPRLPPTSSTSPRAPTSSTAASRHHLLHDLARERLAVLLSRDRHVPALTPHQTRGDARFPETWIGLAAWWSSSRAAQRQAGAGTDRLAGNTGVAPLKPVRSALDRCSRQG
jgi:hypothetical protein